MDALTADRAADAIEPTGALPSSAGRRVLDIRENPGDSAWDSFVARQPDASAYHHAGWPRLIARAFGHEARMLIAEHAGGIVGVLPLIVMRSRVFGRFVISLPFVNAGGLLTDGRDSADVLIQAAIQVARDDRARYLELRHTGRLCPSLAERRHRVAMALALQSSVDRQWDALDRKLRNQVRKAEKSGLTATAGGAELIEPFYEVFARNMRDLGTPVFPLRLFQEVLRTFPTSTTVCCVYRGTQPLAGGVMHRRGDWIEVIWASALREFNPLCPNVLLYWHMIRTAIALGCRTFEFGRCAPGEGTFHFKRQWGAEPQPLVWEYWTPDGAMDFDASPRNPKYARAVAAWRRLPLAVTTRLGPRIVRSIPC